MKYAIVCGHYMPEAGYYEVHLGENLVKAGHTVRVFTSTKSNLILRREKTYQSGLQAGSDSRVQIFRFSPLLRMGSTVLSTGVGREIENYKPDVVLAIGIAKLFPYSVLMSREKRTYRLYSFFGENAEYYSWKGLTSIIKSSLKFLIRSIVKRPFYQLALRNSDRIFLYTPETYAFIKRLVSDQSFHCLRGKYVTTSLGFDSDRFFFNENERWEVRNSTGLSADDFVLLTVTRYNRSKKLEFIIDTVVKFRLLGYPVHYWIIGFDREADLQTLRNYVSSKKASDYIKCFRFMCYEQLRGYQAAADLGIWCQVTISIQQSMGTGLPVLLERKASVSHLIKTDYEGLYFEPSDLLDKMKKGYELFSFRESDYTGMRKNIEKVNSAHFAYSNLIKEIN